MRLPNETAAESKNSLPESKNRWFSDTGSDFTCSPTQLVQRKNLTRLLEVAFSSVCNMVELQLGHFINITRFETWFG